MKNKMRVILVGLGILCSSLAGESNPTAPNDYLKRYAGNFTDTDGDGMSDVGETRYGYDLYDPTDYAQTDYFIDENDSTNISDDSEIGSDTDEVYFRFQKFTEEQEIRIRKFLVNLAPIMYDVVGQPAESFVCVFYNRGGRYGSWQAVNNGRKMLCDDTWNPRLLVHELIHVWKGKYGFSSHGRYWRYNSALSGFEEGCEGIAYEILHDYIEAYPNDSVSLEILHGGAWDNWSSKASNYDVVKHQRFTGGGDFWVDNLSYTDRYNISAVLMQNFQKHDPDFFKKMLVKYYDIIESDSDWRPNRDDLIDLWASVVPELNGVPTKTYLDAMPILNGEKLSNEFYAVSVSDARFSGGGSQRLYCAFADSKKGDFWWSSPIKHSTFSNYGIPTWFGRYLADDGYYYTDNRNQEYRVIVNNVFGDLVTEIDGKLSNPTNSKDGSPSSFAIASPAGLRGREYEIGLYKQTLQFPHYKQYTDKYEEEYYFFGYKGFSQSRDDDYSIFIGIDTPHVTRMDIELGGIVHTTFTQNGCGVFEFKDIPLNFDGVFEIMISRENDSNVYKRTLLNAGTNDGYRHQTFLIIDRDFDGTEDLYESTKGVVGFVETGNKETGSVAIIRRDSESEDEDANSTEYVDINSTVVDDINSTFVVVDVNDTLDVVDDINSTFVVVDVNDTSVVVSEPEFVFEPTISVVDVGLKISWSANDGSAYFLKLNHGQRELIYGGHSAEFAIINLSELNLKGTEILEGKFLEYSSETSEFVRELNEFVLDVSEYISIEPIVVQVETNNSIVIVDDVIAVVVDDANTTIINTNDNVVIVQNTESVVEYSDENSSITDDDNVIVIADDNVTLYTNEDDTHEMNASNSVVTVTEETITIEDDSSKIVEFGGDAPAAPPEVKSAWDTAIAYGNNWYYLEWFGYFFRTSDNDWVFHADHGWMYADWTTSFDSVWMFHPVLGWTWTNSQCFPYFYNSNEQSWVYLAKGGYYEFNSKTWIKFEGN